MRSLQIWSKPPISRLDHQLGGRPYIAIRQLSNVRAAPQVTTLKADCRPPGFLPSSLFSQPVARIGFLDSTFRSLTRGRICNTNCRRSSRCLRWPRFTRRGRECHPKVARGESRVRVGWSASRSIRLAAQECGWQLDAIENAQGRDNCGSATMFPGCRWDRAAQAPFRAFC
jgi:hypothetical protein